MYQNLGKKIVDDGISPGCVLLVGDAKSVIHSTAWGKYTYNHIAPKVSLDTMYDIASITKMVTATAILMLVERGAISLNDKLKKFFDCKYGAEVSIKHLLSYNAIINALMAELAKTGDPKSIEERIMRAGLFCTPGKRAEYRSVNAFLLGKVIESVTGKKLDDFFRKEIFEPLNMKDTVFNPDVSLHKVAPSGYLDKRGFIHGKPYDPSAFALGGVAGHAGLFSTADDLYKFCRMWLNKGELADGSRFFSEKLAEKSIKSHAYSDEVTFGLGWFLNCSWMGRFKKRITSHAGFTGCVINISHYYGLIAILLTNSTMNGKDREMFYKYNAAIMDEVIQSRKSSFHSMRNMVVS